MADSLQHRCRKRRSTSTTTSTATRTRTTTSSSAAQRCEFYRRQRRRLPVAGAPRSLGVLFVLVALAIARRVAWGKCLWTVPTPRPFSERSPAAGFPETERRVVLVGARENENQDDDERGAAIFCAGRRDSRGPHGTPGNERSICSVETVSERIPTPWPINVLKEKWTSRRGSSPANGEGSGDQNPGRRAQKPKPAYPSMGALFLAYAKQQVLIKTRQLSEIASQVWYNLPPSAPPLIVLASIPRKAGLKDAKSVAKAASEADGFRRVIPLFSDPFARSVAIAGLGIAVLSWSNQELQRKRKLSPLALPAMRSVDGEGEHVSVSKVFLPPFLPDEVPEPEIDALLGKPSEGSGVRNAFGDELASNPNGSAGDTVESTLSNVSPKIRKHLSGIYETTTTNPRRFLKNYYVEWLQGRAARKREVAKIRRQRVYDELVALQTLKKRQAASKQTPKQGLSGDAAPPEMGFALVTGASRGIGRAIAVEIARWEIPLVLVARDVDKLARLASDLEACYGVKCCVLEADLSKADAAERIKQATDDAGISVDILINNAGVATEGLAVDADTSDIERMVLLNSLTYTKLSVLYGRDMKKKRRGRMLMMSSMAGLCNGAPNTAVYGACKAFGKSLALSMAREMESYGVGVTCLMPGAVLDTDFRRSSGTRRALVWYLPFYSRSPDMVAHQGVMSLLDGDTRSVPGWQNRVFANIVRPIIPQRVEIMLVQLAFSPLSLPSIKSLWQRNNPNNDDSGAETDSPPPYSPGPSHGSSWLSLKPRHSTQPLPRFLKLPEEEPVEIAREDNVTNHEILEEEASSPSPVTANGTNFTTAATSPREVDEVEDVPIAQSHRTPEIPDSMHSVNSNRTVDRDELHSIEQNSQPLERQEEDHHRNMETYNSNQKSQTGERKIPLKPEKRNSVPRERNASIPIYEKSQEHGTAKKPKHSRDQHDGMIREGAGVGKLQSSQWPQWFDDEYDDDDDETFSTRLRPISMKGNQEFLYSNQGSGKPQGTPIITV